MKLEQIKDTSRQSEIMLSGVAKKKEMEMKEGDYLRRRVDIDDDDDEKSRSTGCLTFRCRSASTQSSGSDDCSVPNRRHHSDGDDSHRHRGRFTEKLLRILRHHSDHAVESAGSTGRPSSSCRAAGMAPRRRFIRVVKDENAPPPETVDENPNIICRYSQQYLRQHYDEVERQRRATGGGAPRGQLPYTTSGHTILKKSSTDPSHYRAMELSAGVLDGAGGGGSSDVMKHATFSKVVTVVETGDGTTHEECLHGNEAEDEEDSGGSAAEEVVDGPKKDFFLMDDSETAVVAAAEVEVDVTAVESLLSAATASVPLAAEHRKDSAAAMSAFFSATAVEPDMFVVENRRALHTTKRVKLTDLMAQLRSDEGDFDHREPHGTVGNF